MTPAIYKDTAPERRLLRLALQRHMEDAAQGSRDAYAHRMRAHYEAKPRESRRCGDGAVNRIQIGKCLRGGRDEATAASYRKLAAYLIELGAYPPPDLEDQALGLMPLAFGAGRDEALSTLARLHGTYAYGAPDENGVDLIEQGRLTITEPHADFSAIMRFTPHHPSTSPWTGRAFCDGRPTLYGVLKDAALGAVKFCIISRFASPDPASPFTSLSGHALCGAAQTGAPLSLRAVRLE